MSQADFTAALLDPARGVPRGLVGPKGAPAGKRFDVYRNNVAVGLTDALSVAFPVVHKLVGDEFFRAMAGVYLRAEPPVSRMMKEYGASFPRFLARFEPARSLAYLPDVARLERARAEAYHAADAPAFDASRLGAVSTEALMNARILLAPATRVLASRYPVLAIWRANMANGPSPQPAAEEVLITRPMFDPTLIALPVGGAAFVAALQKGQRLGAALAAAPDGFDFATMLTALLTNAAITDIQTGDAT